MHAIQRLVSAAVLVCLTSAIGGCAALNTPSWDPTDLLDFLDTKKRAAGDRHPVFPEGVPGVVQGVPPDLMKGTPEHAAALAAADPSLAPPPPPEPPAAEPKPAAKKRVAATPTRIRVAPSEQQADPQSDPSASPADEEPPPASAPPPRKRGAKKPATDPAVSDAQPAPQQNQTFSNQPLQSGSFQR
jgi:hypothetical protein